MTGKNKIQIAIDRGGTFTDCIAHIPGRPESEGGENIVVKLLSHDPANYKDAPREGIRRILESVTGQTIPRGEKIETSLIDYIRLSTTVATNALLERKGEKHALVTTRGFRDIVQIGNQSRPRIFDLSIRKPDVLYSAVIEIDERVTLVGYTSDPKREQHGIKFDDDGRIQRAYSGDDPPPPEVNAEGEEINVESGPEVVQGVSGEAVAILKRPDEGAIRKQLQKLYDDGFRALAIVLLHSFTYPAHELLVEKIAKEVGFTHTSVSSKLMPMIKMVPRGTSTTADAYLTPVLQAYIDGFFSGFDDSLRSGQAGTRVEFMMSDGGLTSVEHFSGLKSIISGPAGGVVGMALTSYDGDVDGRPVIGLDMGGTSTDVSRFAGRYEQVLETTLAGVTIQIPQLDVNTVASGGSSRLFWRNGMFVVGPESASAHPGPACYRKNGPLTITDANLVTGHLAVEMFPKIFGKGENEGLDEEVSRRLFEELRGQIVKETGKEMSVDEVAQGFIRIANETMCRPIRALTEAKGYSASKHILACFGGAGGQHACALARALGMSTVLVHKYSSILSAYGMALADRVFDKSTPASETWGAESGWARLERKFDELEKEVRAELEKQGFAGDRIKLEKMLNMRYDGTDTALMTLKPEDGNDFEAVFTKQYKQEFGFVLKGKPIIIDDVRVKGIGKSYDSLGESVHAEHKRLLSSSSGGFKVAQTALDKAARRQVYFAERGRVETPIVRLKDVQVGEKIEGPAICIDETQTILIEPGCEAHITSTSVWIEVK
ncbi:hypothetical protein OC844_003828 [Tilletia horrida]|nr:hypothetical protein OC844_003828 [Tilletia horrida]